MAATAAQFERSMVRERVIEEIRALLQELGSAGAVAMLSGSSHLERELGLGSLERVELMARLENAFGVRIADQDATQANTPDDLVAAVLNAPESTAESEAGAGTLGGGTVTGGNSTGGTFTSGNSALRASVRVQQLHRKAEEMGILTAETLVDVLRYRAAHDAERAHLEISEDAEGQDKNVTLTFGELHVAAERCAAELARRGVRAGGRVALMLPTSRAFFVSYAGIFLAGAIPVPIYPPFRADRIEEYAARQSAILNNAGVVLLLTFRRAEAVAKLLKPRVSSLVGGGGRGKIN